MSFVLIVAILAFLAGVAVLAMAAGFIRDVHRNPEMRSIFPAGVVLLPIALLIQAGLWFWMAYLCIADLIA